MAGPYNVVWESLRQLNEATLELGKNYTEFRVHEEELAKLALQSKTLHEDLLASLLEEQNKLFHEKIKQESKSDV